ncbi:MAG TPA: septum site-determining protein MinC [Xanthobacteraceae bacterium]|nr:septum site-determining protein MinC [Xanthobacteraceae bacterium]
MTIATRPPRHSFRFRGRNFLALVLKPETPRAAWLADLDQWLARSPGFFTGKPLILDLAGLCFAQSDVVSLMAELDSRAIRIIGIEGADASILDKSLPPLLTGGRTAGSVEAIDAISSRPATPEPSYKDASPAPALAPAPVASLMIETPVRSGQTIMNPDGDVIILGSVASGAEVISSGSIHVYGALRGRALAGAYGNESARVFCRRFEAELIAVGGYYKVLEDIEPCLRQKSVQAWLSGNDLNIATLDQNEKELVTWRKS